MAVKVICHSLHTRGISEIEYFALSGGRLDLRKVRHRFHLLFVILYLNVKEDISFSVLRSNNDLSLMAFRDGDVLHVTGVKTSYGQARDSCRCFAMAVRNPYKMCTAQQYPKINRSRHQKEEKIKTYFTPVSPVQLPPFFSTSTRDSIETSSVEPKAVIPSPPKYRVPHTSPESEGLLSNNMERSATYSGSHYHECSDCSSEEYTSSSKMIPPAPPTRFNTPFPSPEFADFYYRVT